MTNIVPIGFQCTTKLTLESLNIHQPTLPFDWMLAPPKFVYDILDLLVQNLNIETLVKQYFFHNHTLARWTLQPEEYLEYSEGYPYNKDGSAIFPHDGDNQDYNEIIQKYIRRFYRLKEQIFDIQNELLLVYISQSSGNRYQGNFFINHIEILTNSYNFLNKIYFLILLKRKHNFKIIMIDTIKNEEQKILNQNIEYYSIDPQNSFQNMIPECHNILKNYA